MEPGALGRRRRRGGAFSIARLFANGEAGGVYDPSDLTAEKVAWRRNLLTWSEDFTNAAWGKTNATITANAGTSWDGTATASKLTPTTTNAEHWISQTVAPLGALPHTFSFYAKADGYSVVQVLNANDATDRINFDLATGLVGSATTYTGTITSVGGGWYRITATYTTTTSVLAWARIAVVPSSTSARGAAFAGDGTSGVLIDSSQFELGSTATAYQRITDFTSDFLAAFPAHGLYQDAAGTTPVTALGQPVGLVIDSKTGGLANVGPELVSGGVIGLLGTATAATYSTTTGVGACTRVDISNQSYVEWSGLNNARLYRLRVQVTGSVAMWVRSGDVSAMNPFTAAANATTQLIIAPSGGKITLTTQNGTATFTVLAFNEVPGVHAIQPTSSSRPLLDGRVNLLTFSEQFDNAAWTLVNPGTRTANTDVAPDGTTTADTLTDNITGNYTGLRQSFSVPNGSQSYLGSLYFKKTTGAASFPGLTLLYSGGTSKASSVAINTDTGVATARTGEVPDSVEVRDAGAYWRVFVTSANNASGNTTLQMDIWAAVNTNGGATWAAATQGSAVIWGADLRLAADAAYPYQRVAAATDYADVGVPRSFAFDGFDDSFYTASNMDLSGTDKVTVLAGIRKTSDVAFGVAVEHTTGTAGSFHILAPSNNNSPRYGWRSFGTVNVDVTTPLNYPAPLAHVLACIGNIGAPLAEVRANGVQVVSSTSTQGTGNYANAVFYIGRRANLSLPFNGKAYQLIVRGALTDAATLAQAERYVGAKTGLYI